MSSFRSRTSSTNLPAVAPERVKACIEAATARYEAYGFGAPPDLAHLALLKRRLRLAISVVLAVVASISLAHIALGQSPTTVAVRLAFAILELPLLIVCVSVANDYAMRRRLSPLRTLSVTLGTSVAVSTTTLASFWSLGTFVPAIGALWPPEVMRLRLPAILVLGVMLGIVHLGTYALAFVYPFAAHDARVRAQEAERLRTAADLARLRAHLEPHFLLNTLNAIAGLVTEDPREARRLLACLGDLLRDALRDGDEMQSLNEEIAWLRRYAEILESRHKGALVFQWEVDGSLAGVRLPRLLLQPLVENAVKHGALRRRGGGQVIVRAQRSGSGVLLEIGDNGPGFAPGPVRQGALGLEVVRRRLELKLRHAKMRVASDQDGARISIELDARDLVPCTSSTPRLTSLRVS